MKRFRKIAAAVKTGALVLLMTLAMAVPAFAAFDQSVLTEWCFFIPAPLTAAERCSIGEEPDFL